MTQNTNYQDGPQTPNPFFDIISQFIIFIVMIVASLIFSQSCNAQCETSHEDQFSDYMESTNYHCYKSRIGTETRFNWDVNGDGVVNTGDQLKFLEMYGGQILTSDLQGFLVQYGGQGDYIDEPNLCLLTVNTVQSSGVTLFYLPEFESQVFQERPDAYFPNTTDDVILQYTQSDEGPQWPDCLTSTILCLNTFKVVVFVTDDPNAPFASAEEYYFLKL